ncbi:hypothetical protein CFP56_035773 [Quercus suber]|uniref:Uncharacterized protein n=1 Tax=Quercus suber TaxID=58331 RepID=A0AAW0LPR2_QUESU
MAPNMPSSPGRPSPPKPAGVCDLASPVGFDLVVLVGAPPAAIAVQGFGSGLVLGAGEPVVVSELVVEGVVDGFLAWSPPWVPKSAANGFALSFPAFPAIVVAFRNGS